MDLPDTQLYCGKAIVPGVRSISRQRKIECYAGMVIPESSHLFPEKPAQCGEKRPKGNVGSIHTIWFSDIQALR